MSSIPIKSEIHLELHDILDGVAQLDTASLEQFAQKVNQLLARRKAPALSLQETELLKQINTGISLEILTKFQALQLKQRTSELNPSEKQELESLVDDIELAEANRLKHMIVLAELWQISMDQLRKRLGIVSPEPHG